MVPEDLEPQADHHSHLLHLYPSGRGDQEEGEAREGDVEMRKEVKVREGKACTLKTARYAYR